MGAAAGVQSSGILPAAGRHPPGIAAAKLGRMRARWSVLSLLPLVSCAAPAAAPTTLAEDSAFLAQAAGAIRLESGDGWVLVSPSLQGRVMTSGFDEAEAGLGFLNRAEIESPPAQSPFYNYGGEDRFWFGPEGGPFALYFGGSPERDLDHWQVPAALQTGAFAVDRQDPAGVDLSRTMRLQNAVGTTFDAEVRRRIEVPRRAEVEQLVGRLPESAEWVGFRSRNRVRNAGARAWVPEEGLMCVWILGQFAPGERTWVIAPFRPQGDGPPLRDDYFGKVPAERLLVTEDFALFRADAALRSKIGVLRDRALPVAGAYDPDRKVLTLVRFGPIDYTARYLDETWPVDQADPFYGDVLNSYNHGGPEAFFEIESSSPGLELRPGASYEHEHLTVHLRFETDAELAAAAERALGVDWNQVRALAGW